MEVNTLCRYLAQNSQIIHLFLPLRPYLVRIVGGGGMRGPEVIMPYRANPWMPAVFAGLLAVAMVLGTNRPVSAASECIEKPDQWVHQDGHWYYYSDRVHHRRCWYFDSSEVTTSPSSSPSFPGPGLSPNADPQPTWFSRLATGLTQTLSSEPQQNSAPDDSSTATKAVSPKHPKTNKMAQERSRSVSRLETTGVASAGRNDQLLPQSTPEKAEKGRPQLTAADREALFEDFLKWHMDRNIFGRP